MEYVAHGWGVIPGSACDGMTYTKGHTREQIGVLAPVLPSARMLREAHEVWSRWHVAPYGILAPAGETFDVIEVPTWLATLLTGRAESKRLCPVLLAPAGARLFVEPGATLSLELTTMGGVRVADAGALVASPPTRVRGGQVSWWVTPQQVGWGLGDSQVVQNALRGAERARAIGWCGGEIHA